jgi:hypothetical protein
LSEGPRRDYCEIRHFLSPRPRYVLEPYDYRIRASLKERHPRRTLAGPFCVKLTGFFKQFAKNR